MIIRPREIVFLVVVVAAGSLHHCVTRLAYASEHPDALILYPNAKDLWSGKRGGTDQLTYHVDAKFPASGVIGWISYKLQEAGWEPLTYDFLNPQLPSSQVQGWGAFLAGPRDLGTCVHQWIGNWKDRAGNFVRYMFRYRQHGCSPSDLTNLEVMSRLTDLEVTAQYLSAADAQQMQEMMEQFEKQQKLK